MSNLCWFTTKTAVILFTLLAAFCLLLALCIGLINIPQKMSEVHMCDYKACCEDQTDNYFDCDSTGCPNVIPNWTHPNCSGGGP